MIELVGQHIAETSLSIDLGDVVAAIAAILATVFGLLKLVLNQATKDRDSDRKERNEFVNAIKDMAKSNREIAHETKKGNAEAKERNGHLGEQNIQIAELVTKQNKDIASMNKIVTKNLGRRTQLVEQQVVEHQHIESKE